MLCIMWLHRSRMLNIHLPIIIIIVLHKRWKCNALPVYYIMLSLEKVPMYNRSMTVKRVLELISKLHGLIYRLEYVRHHVQFILYQNWWKVNDYNLKSNWCKKVKQKTHKRIYLSLKFYLFLIYFLCYNRLLSTSVFWGHTGVW